MLLNLSPDAQDLPKKPLKRMMTVEQQGSKTVVSINSSSLELLQTCLRKAHYILNLGLRSETESAALAFGTSIHKALEHWYSLPVNQRALSHGAKEQAELMAYGNNLEVPREEGALESIRQFINARYEILKSVQENDKRSLLNGVRILQSYFKRYADDGLEVARDANGPLIEREVEFVMSSTPSLEIRYFGFIDVVLRDTASGNLLITDHKTTSALGQEFYNRCKPNPQYTGYIMGAQRALGLDTSLFMINGIQVAKTKHEFARQITSRTEDDFQQLTESVEECVGRWLNANKRGIFPMSAPSPCAMWGGCQFLKIDELPLAMQPHAIAMMFPKPGLS